MDTAGTFSTLNYIILFAYMGGMLLVGWLFAGKQKTTEDYFLAGRKMPWLMVAMSMFASLTSAVTYMGLPATAYEENVALIVVCIVSPLVAPFLIYLFYPFYRRLKVTTSYEYVGQRFGRNAQYAVSGLFILARIGWLGTVIYAPALALSVVTGLPLWGAIVLMGLIATIYTVLGGIAAVIWTDVAQFVIMVAGAIWLSVTLIQNVPDGASGIITLARETGRLDIFGPISLVKMSGLMVGFTFFFQLMQDYGTDQTTVQRLMTIPDARGTMKAIVFNAVTDFFIIGILLFIGIGMFAYYHSFPALTPEGFAGDRALPFYIVHALPNGVSGFLITAIFAAAMSSMDSGINSLSTVIVSDCVRPLRKKARSDQHDLRLARALTLVLGVIATGVAFYASSFSHVIKAYTTIISLFSGPVLALFLLGMLTRRGSFDGWLIGVLVSVPCTLYVQHSTSVHWTFYFPLAFGLTFVVGLFTSLLTTKNPPKTDLTIWGKRG